MVKFKCKSFWGRAQGGSFTLAFNPIREFIIEEFGITLKSNQEEKKYRWEELKESYLIKKEVRGAGGAREHRTLVLKTPDKKYSFGVSIYAPTSYFENSNELIEEIKKHMRLRTIKK